MPRAAARTRQSQAFTLELALKVLESARRPAHHRAVAAALERERRLEARLPEHRAHVARGDRRAAAPSSTSRSRSRPSCARTWGCSATRRRPAPHDPTLHRRKASSISRTSSPGPTARYQLALLGADVIKVERAKGDDMRCGRRANDWEKRGLAAPGSWAQLQQALDHARPQEAQGDRGREAARRQGRRGDGEFPPRRDGQARHRLRGADGDQSQADLLRRLGLRPDRAGARRRRPSTA